RGSAILTRVGSNVECIKRLYRARIPSHFLTGLRCVLNSVGIKLVWSWIKRCVGSNNKGLKERLIISDLLVVKTLQTAITSDDATTHVVRGVSFGVNKGEIVGIVGESGCGKSVTSLSIMQLLQGTSGEIVDGEVLFHQKNLLEYSEREMRKVRGN